MKLRIWLTGLAVVLAMQSLWAGQNDSMRPHDPVVRATTNEARWTFEAASALNAEALRRNIVQDLEIRDTLVYCLQGAGCGDSCASLMILDISDPTKPTFVSRLRFHGGAEGGYSLKVSGDYVYLTVAAPDWTSILYVVDVYSPTSLAVVGSYPFPATATGIDVANGFAYVVDGVGSQGHSLNVIHVLDVGDPSSITSVASVPTDYFLIDIRTRGDQAYGVGCCDLYTIDIAAPSSAHVVSMLPTAGYYPGSIDFLEEDTLLYIAEGDDVQPSYWSSLTTVNVSSPRSPVISSRFPLSGYVMDVKVQGHWAFVSNGTCGMQFFDISDPANPINVARWQNPSWGTSDGYYSFAGRVAVQDTLLIFADVGPLVNSMWEYYQCDPWFHPDGPHPGDLTILNIANPANPTLLGFYAPPDQDPTGVDDVESDILPTTFTLYQNYPNPFNPGTMIEFDLPVKAEVELSVYNLLGQEVTRLVQSRSAGHHTIQLNMRDQASGVYFYELRAGDYSGTGKMLLLK